MLTTAIFVHHFYLLLRCHLHHLAALVTGLRYCGQRSATDFPFNDERLTTPPGRWHRLPAWRPGALHTQRRLIRRRASQPATIDGNGSQGDEHAFDQLLHAYHHGR